MQIFYCPKCKAVVDKLIPEDNMLLVCYVCDAPLRLVKKNDKFIIELIS